MSIFQQIPVITRSSFQNIQTTFHKFLFQKYSKDNPRILHGYKNIFLKSKSSKNCFVGYPVKILVLPVSSGKNLELVHYNYYKSFLSGI